MNNARRLSALIDGLSNGQSSNEELLSSSRGVQPTTNRKNFAGSTDSVQQAIAVHYNRRGPPPKVPSLPDDRTLEYARKVSAVAIPPAQQQQLDVSSVYIASDPQRARKRGAEYSSIGSGNLASESGSSSYYAEQHHQHQQQRHDSTTSSATQLSTVKTPLHFEKPTIVVEQYRTPPRTDSAVTSAPLPEIPTVETHFSDTDTQGDTAYVTRVLPGPTHKWVPPTDGVRGDRLEPALKQLIAALSRVAAELLLTPEEARHSECTQRLENAARALEGFR
ncbi:Nba1p KNAG_0K01050 [Huiozyma naganishii CBS 8797]|uniref:Uncharacterized protein n=1 Tax=Huiozyma naganishii (strain ATCC MYA-139 / BCRC 22969 / CBS 8797 / KCTC 17520 / NBRC 10181 / NCYC 3082 / Yp74L-3) TaxID=1071383 RepID=J7RC88_HUIN7|nr:hypothetical protein KNAG_0K01050 [Kazachstania naganishii CBS 8797]CCK72470.1 hypothetical protein KNAG_0K01050 [Kazachstania naganishii CBS 8797]